MTILTIVVGLALEVHSNFVGHARTGTAARHLCVTPAGDARVVDEVAPENLLGSRTGRVRLLLEHFEHVRATVAEATGRLTSIELPDIALEQAARL